MSRVTLGSLLLSPLFFLGSCQFFSAEKTLDTTAAESRSQYRSAPEPASERSSALNKVARGNQFVAVTANPHATRAATEILSEGGSAIDAAIAAQMVLGLVEPQSSGLGGGGFMLYWDAQRQQLSSYDGRETAPANVDSSLFLGSSNRPLPWFDAVIGGKSVGVPGLLAMLQQAHERHGVMDWSALFSSAIELSEQGFEVSPRLHSLITQVPRLAVRKPIGKYLFPGGDALEQGDLLVNKPYAKTLRVVAAEGAEAFYHNRIAQDIVDAVANDSIAGALSLSDLAGYRAKTREAVCFAVLEHRLCGMGPPSSGPLTVIAILTQMESLLLREKLPFGVPVNNSVDVAHAFVEATRLAFADRNAYMADPDFVDVPVKALMNEDYLAQRASLIQPNKLLANPLPGELLGFTGKRIVGQTLELPSTTHLSIVDGHGNVLSMTTSIETAFGSRLMSGGFILNNQLTDFSFVPRKENGELIANRVQPNKRPRSSMSPMIVFDGQEQPVLAIGSPGGSSIISYVARVLYDHLAGDLNIEDAVEAKHIVGGKAVKIEHGFDPAIIQALKAKGHDVQSGHQTSGLHILKRDANGWLGVADSRREGDVIAN